MNVRTPLDASIAGDRRLLEHDRRARRRIVPGAEAARALPQLPGVRRRRRCSCSMRDAPAGYLAEWTSHFAQPKRGRGARHAVGRHLPHRRRMARAADAGRRRKSPNLLPIHSLPHRPSGVVLGLANVRGELLICVSLGQVARRGAVRGGRAASVARTAYQRLLVIRRDDVRVVCPVDEVHGIHRFHPRELKDVPATVAKATVDLLDGAAVVARPLGRLLDDQLLFYTLKRSLGMSGTDLEPVLDARSVPRGSGNAGAGADRGPAGARARSRRSPISSRRACARPTRSKARRASSASTSACAWPTRWKTASSPRSRGS